MKTILDLINEQAFFKDLSLPYRELIAGCGRNRVFNENETMASYGQPAEVFYLVRSGRVLVETTPSSGHGLVVQTLGPGEILGWSWLFPPYQWTFDVIAAEKTHVIEFDASCLRRKCEADSAMGYAFLRKFAGVMTDRLRATRLQLLDIYGTQHGRN